MDKVERTAAREENARIFGANLKRVREERGLKQVELAKMAGLNRTHVGDFERGKRSPVLNSIKVLAEALGVSAGELVDDPTTRPGRAPDEPKTP
jgi:XRE family transcriptional regulator, regulator of sulfur utilization